ncbi:MAG: FHA domain-containing protein, partial [Planctomycetes bacterium]|nr:FHA domain-containing protein [Planctomycetota bacterium]
MPYLLTRSRDRRFCGQVQLPAGSATIGRSPRATIRIQDRSVSKIHASIEPIPGSTSYKLRDLGSRNGIYFLGERRTEFEMAPGDEARLGMVLLTLCSDAAPGVVMEAIAAVAAPAAGAPIAPETVSTQSTAPSTAPSAPAATERESFLSRGERGLLLVFLLLGGLLGVVVWQLPAGTLPWSIKPAAERGD